MNPVLVLCLGNEVLSDDAFGFKIAGLLQNEGSLGDRAEVIYASLAGFNLIEFFRGRERVLIVDTIITGEVEPGTVRLFPSKHLTPSHCLTTSHQISLPTALSLGKKLGITMPEIIDVLTVEAQDVQTLCEQLTPRVEEALNPTVDLIKKWVPLES